MQPKPTRSGAFVVLEGGDGVGKSTNTKILAELLTEEGYRVTATRAPGATDVGAALREIVLHQYMPAKAELLLFAADRENHIQQVIKPAMERGEVVVSDRFHISSRAYQGYGRGLKKEVKMLEEFVHQGFYPDHILFLNLPPEVARTRLEADGKKLDRFETATQAILERIAQGYRIERAYAALTPEEGLAFDIDVHDTVTAVKAKLRRWIRNHFNPQFSHLKQTP